MMQDMTINGLTVFENEEFGQLRTVRIDEVLYFVGKDVAEALGYTDVNHCILDHVEEEDRVNSKTQGRNDPEFGQRGTWLINESGLYSLVLSSKLESAKKFKRWVTSEVLPSIRQTGSYVIHKTDPKEIACRQSEILLRIAQETETSSWKELMLRGAANIVAGYELLPPLVMPRTYSATEVGKHLGMSANKVGRIATKYGLKTEEYGVWCHDVAKNGQKEVSVFRYNDNGIKIISEYMQRS